MRSALIWLAGLVLANLVLAIWFPRNSSADDLGELSDQSGIAESSVPTLTLLSEQQETEVDGGFTGGGSALGALDPASNVGAQPKAATETRIEPSRDGKEVLTLADRTQASAKVSEVLACVAFGPFVTQDEARSLEQSLAAKRYDAELLTRNVQEPPDYLVYIGPLNSRDRVRQVREELQSQQIESHLIARGEIQNILSVGVFSQAQRARNQRDRVAALGYEAKLDTLSREHQIHHLLARVPETLIAAAPVSGACADIAPGHRFL